MPSFARVCNRDQPPQKRGQSLHAEAVIQEESTDSNIEEEFYRRAVSEEERPDEWTISLETHRTYKLDTDAEVNGVSDTTVKRLKKKINQGTW